ncbi:MAG TPA: tetratricopeptide repeat protein [Verrucomicrobiae bacterium]
MFALLLSAGQLFAAADGKRSQRVYNAAVVAYQDGNYPLAETGFAQFIQRFPDSTNVPESVLMEAQSAYKQNDFTNAIVLLRQNMDKAGALADQYVYWIGEVEFAGHDFTAAAETFGSLVQNYPNSSLRLQATDDQADSLRWANQWPEAISLFEQTNGVFEHAAQLDPGNNLISWGRELWAQGLSVEGKNTNALMVLKSINSKILTPDLYAGLERLFYQLNLATSNLPVAFEASSNLYQAAKILGNNDLMAESVVMRANVLEQMGQMAGAIAAYSENLATNTPEERLRQAILQITRLAIQEQQYAPAENSISPLTNSPEADAALLALGELQLRDYAGRTTDTNLLAAAQANLGQFISGYPNSPMAGEARLNRGWCFWLEKDYADSLPDFQAATNLLPEDLAVAKFKAGDVEFAAHDFTNALNNYLSVENDFTNATVVQMLGEPVEYQILRTSLALTNLTVASNAMAQILTNYPSSEADSGSELLFGESLAEASQPAAALQQFLKFEKEFTNSPLRPQVDFSIARSYELENDWTKTIVAYTNWLGNFPTNDLRSQVTYLLALANSEAGNESNAFALFTNFIAQYPTSEFAPQAQWWVAEHFFRQGGTNYLDAEKNYEFVYQNFPTNKDLDYAARLMAGRSAAERQDFTEAINGYFTQLKTDLEADTNYPDLLNQTLLAYGKTLMQMPSTDTNNLTANFPLATNVFYELYQRNPTNEFGALACNYIGDCSVQLTNYDVATNYYTLPLNPDMTAAVSTRSMAQVGLGAALEQKAALATGTNQAALLHQALANYLDVFYENNLRDGETADPFWTKKAGLQALSLIETLDVADPNKFINRMEYWLPQLKDSLEKMRASLPSPKS